MNTLRQRIEAIPTTPQPKRYRVVEFGVGATPHPAPCIIESLRHERNPAWSFDGERSYLGVDDASWALSESYRDDPEWIRSQARQRLAEYQARYAEKYPAENIRLLFGSAPSLDLPPDSTDEILMFNLLSSNIEDRTRRRLLVKARYLLTAGGLLVARETFTPNLYKPDEVTAELGRLGFASEVVGTTDPLFEPLTEHYGHTVHDYEIPSANVRPRPDRYFCFAEPV